MSVGASGDKLCGKMREKDPDSKTTVRPLTVAIQDVQCAYTTNRGKKRERERREEGEGGKRGLV